MTVTALLFRLFRPAEARSLEIAPASVRLRYRDRVLRLPHRRIAAVETSARAGFASLVLRTGETSHTLPGLGPGRAARLAREIKSAREEWWRAAIAEEAPTLDAIRRSLDWLADPPEHVGAASGRRLAATAAACVEALSGHWPEALRDTAEYAAFDAIREFARDPQGALADANRRYLARELAAARDLFERIESRPLTDEQRRAVAIDQKRNLVIASAGSGKTSVIVAKAAWLIRRGLRQPSDILLLAFAREASREMEDRIASRFGAAGPEGLTVRTFHALGRSILRDADGRAPSLSHTADDPAQLTALVKEIVADLLASPAHTKALLNWLQNRFEPDRGDSEFSNLGEYYDYIRQFDLRSLRGEKVKSFGECDIANFLYLNGVPYEYEAHYEHDTATARRRQYRPDFHLAEAGVYIEYFGLDSRGRPPPYLDGEDYLRQRAWKLALHRKHGTDLIETFSHQRSNGILPRVLANALAERGIALAPIPTEEVFTALEQQGRIDPFIRLAATFLHHFNSAGLSYEDLARRIAASRARERGEAFLAVFRPIAERYRQTLHERGMIDFNDMIHRAARLVEQGRYRSPWSYILIDEFQDISPARARLLKALIDQSPANRLFAVGDDWQAISRFAGSDISIMRDFDEHFGEAAQLRLETTFRCPDRLAEAATRFVLRNPAQIPKTVRSPKRAGGPCIHVGLAARDGVPLLDEALKLAAGDAERTDGRSDVLLLGRYNRLKPDMRALKRAHPALSLAFRTIHASKGLEADYVIVLGLNGGKFAFPTEISDDRLLDLVLAKPEAHPNAEERRLFYVALTRARRHVFLIAGEGPPSSFTTELVHGGYDITLFGRRPAPETPCPSCTGGRLQRRKHPRTGQTFHSCSNYPLCRHAEPACPACGTGLPIRRRDDFQCPDCRAEIPACPRCQSWLRPKTGPSGEFLGCASYPACRYTRPLDSNPSDSPRDPPTKPGTAPPPTPATTPPTASSRQPEPSSPKPPPPDTGPRRPLRIGDPVRFAPGGKILHGHLLQPRRGRRFARVIDADDQVWRVRDRDMAADPDRPRRNVILTPGDLMRATLSPGDTVDFYTPNGPMRGVIVKFNPARAQVQAGDDIWNAPYTGLKPSDPDTGARRRDRLQATAATARQMMDRHGLTDWTLAFSESRRVLGRCHHEEQVIRIALEHAASGDDRDVRDTVLHEIAHAIAGPGAGHGPAWKDIAREIGATPAASKHETEPAPVTPSPAQGM